MRGAVSTRRDAASSCSRAKSLLSLSLFASCHDHRIIYQGELIDRAAKIVKVLRQCRNLSVRSSSPIRVCTRALHFFDVQRARIRAPGR